MGLLRRWRRRWHAWRLFAAELARAESAGYGVSPPAYQRLRQQARKNAGPG